MNSSEMLTCSMDCTLKVWDIEIGGFSNNLLGSKAFLDLCYSPLNQSIVTAHADRHIRLWDPRSKQGRFALTNVVIRLWTVVTMSELTATIFNLDEPPPKTFMTSQKWYLLDNSWLCDSYKNGEKFLYSIMEGSWPAILRTGELHKKVQRCIFDGA